MHLMYKNFRSPNCPRYDALRLHTESRMLFADADSLRVSPREARLLIEQAEKRQKDAQNADKKAADMLAEYERRKGILDTRLSELEKNGSVYCSNGWVEIDNNIAENALRGVAVGRKNWLFAGSDSGGEHAAVLYSLIGTCRLNNVEPEKWLRYVIEHIQDWPGNRVRGLLPWKVDLSSQ